jgi:hypothetical protein
MYCALRFTILYSHNIVPNGSFSRRTLNVEIAAFTRKCQVSIMVTGHRRKFGEVRVVANIARTVSELISSISRYFQKSSTHHN